MDKKETNKVISAKIKLRRSAGSAKKNLTDSIENDAEKMAMVMQLVCW